jgi:hypothetical protein
MVLGMPRLWFLCVTVFAVGYAGAWTYRGIQAGTLIYPAIMVSTITAYLICYVLALALWRVLLWRRG